MDERVIYSKLTEIFREVFDDDSIELSPATTAADIPEWDSLKHINITVASEAAFRVRFRGSELEELRNVGDLVAAIQSKIG